jgi:hypothetical protein
MYSRKQNMVIDEQTGIQAGVHTGMQTTEQKILYSIRDYFICTHTDLITVMKKVYEQREKLPPGQLHSSVRRNNC